eukprot:3021237-Alexandrium_andersonii.AAC.1
MGGDFLHDPLGLNPACGREARLGLRRAVVGALLRAPPLRGGGGSCGVGRCSVVELRAPGTLAGSPQ